MADERKKLREYLDKIKTAMDQAEVEYTTLVGGTKAAGQRLRARLMDIRESAHAGRSATTDLVNKM